jgi:hypothetical protein
MTTTSTRTTTGATTALPPETPARFVGEVRTQHVGRPLSCRRRRYTSVRDTGETSCSA